MITNCTFHVEVKWKFDDGLTGSFSFENRDHTDTERDLMQQMEVENTR